MSTITIINNSTDAVRCALYRKPKQNTLSAIAWKIVEPPPNGGQTLVQIPDDYGIFASYSLDPIERLDPAKGNRTPSLSFDEYSARFLVNSAPTQDNKSSAAVITQSFVGLVTNEVHLENNFSTGVWGHVTKDGDEVYPPQVLWPGAVLMEDIRSTFFAAVVSQFVFKGTRLVDAETSLTEATVLEGGVLTITGTMWEGYSLA